MSRPRSAGRWLAQLLIVAALGLLIYSALPAGPDEFITWVVVGVLTFRLFQWLSRR